MRRATLLHVSLILGVSCAPPTTSSQVSTSSLFATAHSKSSEGGPTTNGAEADGGAAAEQGSASNPLAASWMTGALRTVAGDLSVVELEDHQVWELRLGAKTVVRTDMRQAEERRGYGYMPTVEKLFDGLAPYDQAALIHWSHMGNACNGTAYTFLGLRKDGSFALSEDYQYCGGPAPVITRVGQRVTFAVPDHRPNRGSGVIPGETWVYEEGRLTRIK